MAGQNSDSLKSSTLINIGIGIVIGFVIGNLYTQVNYLKKPTADAGTAGKAGTQEADVQGAQDPEAPKELKIAKPDPSKDHWKGDKKARYVMVEYSDFECPFCARFFPTAQQIEKEYGSKLAIVYRHFPLSFHPKAMPAALASECVADLGGSDAFWKFHDELFTSLATTEISGIADLAQKIGVSKSAVQTCMDDKKFESKVNAQLTEGTNAGIAATPTSVIYDMETGKTAVIEGALPFESAKQIIDGLVK